RRSRGMGISSFVESQTPGHSGPGVSWGSRAIRADPARGPGKSPPPRSGAIPRSSRGSTTVGAVLGLLAPDLETVPDQGHIAVGVDRDVERLVGEEVVAPTRGSPPLAEGEGLFGSPVVDVDVVIGRPDRVVRRAARQTDPDDIGEVLVDPDVRPSLAVEGLVDHEVDGPLEVDHLARAVVG